MKINKFYVIRHIDLSFYNEPSNSFRGFLYATSYTTHTQALAKVPENECVEIIEVYLKK